MVPYALAGGALAGGAGAMMGASTPYLIH